MNETTFDRRSLRFSAALLLVGQALYVVITLFHTGGEANNHPAIFAAYARSGIWTAVHVAQFACMTTMLAGLLGLFSALDVQGGTPKLASRLGVTFTTTTLATAAVELRATAAAAPISQSFARIIQAPRFASKNEQSPRCSGGDSNPCADLRLNYPCI